VGLTAGGVNVSRTTPLSVEVTAAASGQMLSGSTVRVVNRLNADVTVSGSTQLVAPQGAGNMIRVLSVHAISNGTVMTKWQTTGSSGATGISGYVPLTTLGGIVLPYNPHGWFQTNSNEGLNIALDTPGVNVGISLTWMLA
jgi:hypothetical protein